MMKKKESSSIEELSRKKFQTHEGEFQPISARTQGGKVVEKYQEFIEDDEDMGVDIISTDSVIE